MKVKAFMVTQRQHHGARSIAAREVKSSATIGKLNALLKAKKSESSTSDSSENSNSKAGNKPAQAYGSHNGSTHVQQICEVMIDQNQEEVSAILESSLNALASRESINIRERKYQYKVAKDNLESKFRNEYGTRLTEDLFASLQNAKAEVAFDYYATQIVVVMTDSEEQFDGSEWDEDRKAFVLITKSKTVYTEELLVGVAKEIAGISEQKRKSRLEINKSYDTNKVVAVYDDEKRGFYRLRADEETRRILGLSS
jgi:hypothetical protein